MSRSSSADGATVRVRNRVRDRHTDTGVSRLPYGHSALWTKHPEDGSYPRAFFHPLSISICLSMGIIPHITVVVTLSNRAGITHPVPATMHDRLWPSRRRFPRGLRMSRMGGLRWRGTQRHWIRSRYALGSYGTPHFPSTVSPTNSSSLSSYCTTKTAMQTLMDLEFGEATAFVSVGIGTTLPAHVPLSGVSSRLAVCSSISKRALNFRRRPL